MIVAVATAFFLMVVLDFIWAWYTMYVVAKRPWMAGYAAAGITVCNGLSMILIIKDPWMIVPTALGAFVGTAIAVHFKSHS